MDTDLDITEDLVRDIDAARMLYIVHGAGLLFAAGALNLLPYALNLMRQKRTQGWVQTHHAHMARSFIIFFVMLCVGALTVRFTVGGLIILAAWIIFARQLYVGYQALVRSEPAPSKASSL